MMTWGVVCAAWACGYWRHGLQGRGVCGHVMDAGNVPGVALAN